MTCTAGVAQLALLVAPVAGGVPEALATRLAPVRPLLGVTPQVHAQVSSPCKRPLAVLAHKRLLSTVRALVDDDVPPVIS